MGIPLHKVSELEYLGVFLTEDMERRDCNRALNSFLRQFNAMFHKFKFLPWNILIYLFKIYTNYSYGIIMWFEEKFKSGDLKTISKATKGLAGMHAWDDVNMSTIQ